MSTIEVRELRRNAIEVLLEVKAGDSVTVTVVGRPIGFRGNVQI
jgi:prevent-host-death family protein